MAPLLLDNRSIIKLSFFSVAITVIVFSGGFVFGYQQATFQHLTSSTTEPLSLPIKNARLVSEIEQQKPEVIDAGVVIDVDQPAPVKGLAKHIETIDTAVAQISNEKIHKTVKKDLPVTAEITSDAHSPVDSVPEIVIITDDVINKARFSIQVGMYKRLDNANVMVEKLLKKNMNAYVVDYLNKNNKVRFNVRFGYYAKKKSAFSAIEKFRELHEGDGYLVNYSVNTLLHYVANENVNKEVDVVALDTAIPESEASVKTEKNEQLSEISTTTDQIKIQAGNQKTDLVKSDEKLIYN